jgi:hypothetical protein
MSVKLDSEQARQEFPRYRKEDRSDESGKSASDRGGSFSCATTMNLIEVKGGMGSAAKEALLCFFVDAGGRRSKAIFV